MSEDSSSNIETHLFIGMCCLIYFSSYITRVNYGAAIAEIITSLNITKTAASMAVTGSFITYGAGQVLSGIVGDHIKPKTMIFIGLLITATCNFTMSISSSVYIMTAIWCVNGFAQSMMWPPLTRIMVENLSEQNYRRASVAVSAAASVATILIYIIVPLCITFFGWRSVFLLSAIWGLAVGALWVLSIDRIIEKIPDTTDKAIVKPSANSAVDLRKLFLSTGLIYVTVVIVLQGILRDGITTWMPSYIDDIFKLGTSIAILSAAILPIFSIISVFIASYMQRKFGDELVTSTVLWGCALFCSFVLIFVFDSHAIIAITTMAIITGCMHGINLMLIGILPSQFKSTGRVSTVSGFLNAFTYVGSAISTYGIAALSDNFGWKVTTISWCIILLLGTIMNAITIRKWFPPNSNQAKA